MWNYRKIAGSAMLTAVLMMGSLALAADAAKKPSGKVRINETQFGLIIGGSSGGGVGSSLGFGCGGGSVGRGVSSSFLLRASGQGQAHCQRDQRLVDGHFGISSSFSWQRAIARR